MTRTCPKCNSQAYDDNSFFCHKCGTQLSPITPERLAGPEKKMSLSQRYKTLLPGRKTTFVRDDSLQPKKPAQVQPFTPEHSVETLPEPPSVPVPHVSPIEVCAHCGGLVLNKNRVFCENCGVNIREERAGDGAPVLKHPVPGSRIQAPVVHHNAETRILKEPEPVQVQGSRELLQPKTRKLIVILAGIALIVIMLLLVFMLMLTSWASLY